MTRLPALRNRSFALVWGSVLVSNIGARMEYFALSWLIYKMTSDPLYLGWHAFAASAPLIVMTPIGGAVADRFERQRLLKVTQTALMTISLVVAVIAAMRLLRPWHILVSSALSATLLAFDNPARQTLLVELVPKRDLQNAVALNSVSITVTLTVGPALGGLLVGPFGAHTLVFANALSYLFVILALFRIRHVQESALGTATSVRELMLGGLQLIKRDSVASTLLFIAVATALTARAYYSLVPVFAERVFHAGVKGYAILATGGGLGGFAGVLALALAPNIQRKGRFLLVVGVILCAALTVFALAPSLLLATAALMVAGAAAHAFTSTCTATMMGHVAPTMRGRVMGLMTTTNSYLHSFGALGLAFLAKSVSPSYAMLVGVTFCSIALLSVRRRLVRIGLPDQQARVTMKRASDGT